MKQYAKSFYHSDAWQRCRRAYIQKRMLTDGGLCEQCKVNQGYIVHHKIYLNESNINNPHITLNESNLMYVCKQCHDNYEGHGVHGKTKQMKVLFDDNGMPISRRQPPPVSNTQ